MHLAVIGLPRDRFEDIFGLIREGDEEILPCVMSALRSSQAVLVSIVLDASLGDLARTEAVKRLNSQSWARTDVLQAVRSKVKSVGLWAGILPVILQGSGWKLTDLGFGGSLGAEFSDATLLQLLSEVKVKQWELFHVVPLMTHSNPEIRAGAARLLGEVGVWSKANKDALVKGLQDQELSVVLACSRSLLETGHWDSGWHLLASPRAADRNYAYGFLKFKDTWPEEMKEAFIEGRLWNPEVVKLLEQISVSERAKLVGEAFPNLLRHDDILVFHTFTRLGLAGAELMPEILGHPRAEVRARALRVLDDLLLRGLDFHATWLARQGAILPLDHPHMETRTSLHEVLASAAARLQAWREPGILPLLDALARSPSLSSAGRAIEMLGKRWAILGDEAALEPIFDALVHPERVVRLLAVTNFLSPHISLVQRQVLAVRVSQLLPDPDSLVQLTRWSLQLRSLGLGPYHLRAALKLLNELDGSQDSLLVPKSPEESEALREFLDDEALGATVRRLLRKALPA